MNRIFSRFKKKKSDEVLSVESLLNYIQFNENPINNREKRLHPFVNEAFELVFHNDASLTGICNSKMTLMSDEKLGSLFDIFGSDKNSRHSYSSVYASILNRYENPRILEIGLGSINGYPYGGLNPGGSIKAWREFNSKATIIGVDIDQDAVASIDEIGFVMDQTSNSSIKSTKIQILKHVEKLDLIVDDGFHDPHANVRTYLEFYDLLDDKGYYVIEDVHGSLIPMYAILSKCMPGKMQILDLRAERESVEDNVLVLFRK